MAEPDLTLIQGCIKQKPAAQRALYDRYAPKMLAICYRYAYHANDAEDMLQEAFVKVFRNIVNFDDRGSLEGWIRRIVVNTAIDHIRRNKKHQQHADVTEGVGQAISADVLGKLELDFLFKIIQALPDGYRTVFNLYAIEGFSHAEIGAKLGISESTSRSQYTRARAMLQKRIQEAYMETNLYKDVI